MFNLIIGQYVPLDSLIHRMDPRSKLTAVFLSIIIIFLANNWVTYGLISLFCLAAVILSKIPLVFLYRGLRSILFIILLAFILNLMFTSGGPVLLEWGWFRVTAGGLVQSVFISIRLLIIVVLTTLLTLTTSPLEITDGLETMLQPLKKMKLPVHEFALMMSISLRFIPTLLQETEKIIKAQAARGSDITSGSLKSRVKALVPLLVPLFVGAFKRAEDLAMAMEARGYHGDQGRTRFRELCWARRDTLMMAATAVLTVLLIVLRS